MLADPIEACEPIKYFTEGETSNQLNTIAVIRRGRCRISVKARNAQHAGAKIALIVDDRSNSFFGEWFGHEQGGMRILNL